MVDPSIALGFHHALREAISASGLTLEALQRRLAERNLPVARSTLSFWQNGRRLPTGPTSIAVLEALEQILKTPEGHLRTALSDAQPQPPDASYGVTSVGERLREIYEEMGCREEYESAEIVGYINVGRVGARGVLTEMTTTLAIRASAELDRFPILHGSEQGADAGRIAFELHGGGRLGLVRELDDAPISVGEVIFDRQLRRGETHLLRYTVRDGNHLPSDSYYILMNQPRAFVAFEMTFDGQHLPQRVEEFEKLNDDGPDVYSRNRLVGPDLQVAIVRQRARRGIIGMRWRYA